MTNIFKPTTDSLQKAADIIKKGGVIATPTDTVYGLSADIYNIEAVKRIFEIKKRPHTNPIITLISDIKDLNKLGKTDDKIMSLANKFWPGPLTMIIERIDDNDAIDFLCCGNKGISIRLPDNKIVLDIIKKSGTFIASTSANLSGKENPLSAEEVYKQLGNTVDMIIDGGTADSNLTSTLVNMTASPPKILREGLIPSTEIL